MSLSALLAALLPFLCWTKLYKAFCVAEQAHCFSMISTPILDTYSPSMFNDIQQNKLKSRHLLFKSRWFLSYCHGGFKLTTPKWSPRIMNTQGCCALHSTPFVSLGNEHMLRHPRETHRGSLFEWSLCHIPVCWPRRPTCVWKNKKP